MTTAEFTELLSKGECEDLDWKAKFPLGICGGRRHPHWDNARAELLKDLVALANGANPFDAHLVYGVHDDGATRKIVGLDCELDDAQIQEWSLEAFRPAPKFLYSELELEDGERVGIISIQRVPDYPHQVRKNLGGTLCEGQVWFRMGTRNSIAGPEELRQMMLAQSPFTFSSSFDSLFQSTMKSLQVNGREFELYILTEKEARVFQGYEIAYWPGTRREIHVIGRSDHKVLLIKPTNIRSAI